MALIHADFVEETTTTTGTGSLTLAGATTGNHTFSTKIGNGNTCIYGIAASDGTFESGVGTVSAGVLARTTLLSSSTDSALDLPAGTHTVYCTFAAEGGTKAYLPSGASELSDLSDVGVTTPTDKNVLVADGDSWESRALAEADISDLGTYLTSVATPVTNDFARFTDADTIEGRSYAEARADLSLEVGADVQAYAAPLDNVSGTNTGDQTITLTGDVTGTGTGSFATTIAADAVDLSMLSATGVPSASNFLRGDNTWDIPSTHPPRTAVSISTGAAAFELDGSAYTCQLSEDLTTPTVPLPSGGNAASFEYGCRVDFTAPGAGGPFAVSIPTAWLQLGPLDAISLSAGDEAIVMVLTTYVDGTIGYTAAQGVPGA